MVATRGLPPPSGSLIGSAMYILPVNLVFTTFVLWLAARIYVLPRLGDVPARTELVPILLLHSTRNLGLMFLAPGAIYPGMPPEFAYPAAYGDLLAAVLALASLAALMTSSRAAKPLVWAFNIEGTLDLINAIVLANVYNAGPVMGPSYWIPAFWVP